MAKHIHVYLTPAKTKDFKKANDSEMTRLERAISQDPEGQARYAASKKMTEQQLIRDLAAYGIDKDAPHVKKYLGAFRKAKNETKDADWSARHVGNFRFEVTTPQGKKISISRAETSAEAIEKAKKLPAGATHDSSLEQQAHAQAAKTQSVDPKKGWAHSQRFEVNGKSVNVDFDGKVFRAGMMRSSTLQGLLDLFKKTVKDSSFTGTEFGWKNKVKDSYPAASFRIRPAGKVVAKVGDKDVGEYDKQKGAGTIVDKTA